MRRSRTSRLSLLLSMIRRDPDLCGCIASCWCSCWRQFSNHAAVCTVATPCLRTTIQTCTDAHSARKEQLLVLATVRLTFTTCAFSETRGGSRDVIIGGCQDGVLSRCLTFVMPSNHAIWLTTASEKCGRARENSTADSHQIDLQSHSSLTVRAHSKEKKYSAPLNTIQQ